jgi:hypothetical protein
MAIVGGTQLLLHPDQAIAMSTVGQVLDILKTSSAY